MKNKNEENIVTNKRNISMLEDDSALFRLNATSVVVLKTFFEEEYSGEAKIFNFDLMSLERKNSVDMRRTVPSRLNSYDFSH